MCQRVKVQRHRGIGKGFGRRWVYVWQCECCWVEGGGGWTSRKACLPWQHMMWGDCQWSSIWTRETQGKHWEGWRKRWVLVSECWFDATLCVNDQLPLKIFDNHIFISKINLISVSFLFQFTQWSVFLRWYIWREFLHQKRTLLGGHCLLVADKCITRGREHVTWPEHARTHTTI